MVVLIALTVVVTGYITFDQCLVYAPSEQNVLFGVEDGKGNSYVYFESSANAGIYKLNENNKLMASVVDGSGNPWDGGKVIDLIYSSGMIRMAVRTQSGLKIFAWSDDLKDGNSQTVPFSNDVVVSSVCLSTGSLLAVTIEKGGTEAVVYRLGAAGRDPEVVYFETAEGGLRFLDARYVNERLERLMSDGSRTPGFAASTDERTKLPENVGFMGISMGFSTVVRNILFMVAIIFAIIFFFRTVVFKRNYVWLKIYGFMILVALCLSASIYLVNEPVSHSRAEERMRESEDILRLIGRDFVDYDGSLGTARYDEAYKALSGYWGKTGTIADLCVTSINNGRALVNVSTQLPYGQWLADSWGEAVDDCIEKAHAGNSPVWNEITLKGVSFLTVALPITDEAGARSFISAIVQYEDIIADNAINLITYLGYMFFVWGCALVIIIIISYMRARELKVLSTTLTRVCSGDQLEVVKPHAGSKDFERMWNAAAELSKVMERNNYLKNQTLTSVSRFAPQNIEKFLGRDSITDVRVGDRGSVNGTVALVEVARPFIRKRSDYMDYMSRNIEILCKYKSEYSGVIISDSATMCSSRILFANENGNPIAFGVRTVEALIKSDPAQRKRALILLHKTEYEYGITGSADQSFACISSTQLDAIALRIPKLMDLGLRVVASEDAMANHVNDYSVRYIGYLELGENGGNVKLYEVLDSAPMEERNRKKQTAQNFRRALDLYYTNDFYLARNVFTEVIKDCPEDLVARWYLFRCEGMLDGGKVEQFGYGLLSE